MKKLTLIAALLFATSLAANPLDAIKHRVLDKKFWTVTAINVGLGIITSRAIQKCRADHGIGPCQDGGYGDFNAREGVRQAFVIGMELPAFKVKQIEDEQPSKHKTWWAILAVPIGINTEILVANRLKHYGPKEN